MKHKKLIRSIEIRGLFERSSRRIAAARRSVQADIERNALTPELVKYGSVDERLDARERNLLAMEIDTRARRAKAWLDGRRRLRALPEPLRTNTLRWWQRGIYPLDPGFLQSLVGRVERGQFDPQEEEKAIERCAEIGRHWRENAA